MSNAGRKHTDDEVMARRKEVESLIAQGGWRRDAIHAMARRHGVDWREIYRDRAHVLEALREALVDPDPTRAKVDLLIRARELYQTCAAVQENRATAARLLDFEARVVGAYEPLKVDLTHRVEQMPDVDAARQILDPQAQAWARAVLADAGEEIPGVLTIDPAPVLLEQDGE